MLQPSAKKGPGVLDVRKTAFFLNRQAAKNRNIPSNVPPAARSVPPPPASEGSKDLKKSVKFLNNAISNIYKVHQNKNEVTEIKLAQHLITSAQQYVTSLQAPPLPPIPKPLPNPNNAITYNKCYWIFASTKERDRHVKNVHGK